MSAPHQPIQQRGYPTPQQGYHIPPPGYPVQPGYDHLPPGYPPPTQQPRPQNGLGTAAFVLGLLAALFSWIPIVGVIGWPLSILGLVFGIVGITKVNRKLATNKGLAISGTALAAVGLVLCILWTVAFGAASGAGGTTSSALDGAAPAAPAAPGAPAAPAADPDTPLAFGQTWTSPNGNTIVAGLPELGESESPLSDGGTVVRVPVTLTNNGDEEWAVVFTTFAGTMNGTPAPESTGEGDWLYSTPLGPGASVTIAKVFEVDGGGDFLLTVTTPQAVAYFTGQV